MIDRENVWTPLLDAQMALSKLHLCVLVWEAWTDFGSVGAGRRADVRKSDRKPHTSGHPRPRVDPTKRIRKRKRQARLRTAHLPSPRRLSGLSAQGM